MNDKMKERVRDIYGFIKKFGIPYTKIGEKMGYHHSYLTRVFTSKVKVSKKFYISLENWVKSYRNGVNHEVNKIFVDPKKEDE